MSQRHLHSAGLTSFFSNKVGTLIEQISVEDPSKHGSLHRHKTADPQLHTAAAAGSRQLRRGRKRRFQIHQVYAHATILHDALTIRRLFKERRLRWATQTALHWQPDKDDDLDEMEVLQHLLAQARTSPLLAEAASQNSRSNATNSLFTSCSVPSPPGLASSCESLASFRRYCIRWSILSIWGNDLSMCESAIPEVVSPAPKRPRGWWPYLELKIDGANRAIGLKPAVIWHLQFDFVDLQSPRSHPSSRPGKRRRTTVNPFHQVPSTRVHDSSATYHLPEVKRFKGVRYRHERKSWVAEMRPSKAKNKIHFGDFKYQVEAACAVDAAFHFYGRPELLNFPETTPQILSTIPLPAGLDEKDMKRFVKDKAKVLALRASEFPSEIPESSSRGWAANTLLGFDPDSEIASLLTCGDGDDGIFQPQPWLNLDPITSWVSNGLKVEPNSVAADAGGAVNDTLEAGQVMFQCNSLNGIADPFSCATGSSVHITDGWDGRDNSSAVTLTNFMNSSLPTFESQRTWMESLLMSPSPLIIPSPTSPRSNFQDVAHGLLEQHSCGGERPLGMT